MEKNELTMKGTRCQYNKLYELLLDFKHLMICFVLWGDVLFV